MLWFWTGNTSHKNGLLSYLLATQDLNRLECKNVCQITLEWNCNNRICQYCDAYMATINFPSITNNQQNPLSLVCLTQIQSNKEITLTRLHAKRVSSLQPQQHETHPTSTSFKHYAGVIIMLILYVLSLVLPEFNHMKCTLKHIQQHLAYMYCMFELNWCIQNRRPYLGLLLRKSCVS